MQKTPADKRLWYRINNKQLHGLHIRRQHPIGKYIVDFYIHKLKLVIELDGSSHEFHSDQDSIRDEWLKKEGYDVIRILSRNVMKQLPDVLETLHGYVALKLKETK